MSIGMSGALYQGMKEPEKNIIIIENDTMLLVSLAFTLKRHEYGVCVASNLDEALSGIRDGQTNGHPVCLLLVDVHMPDLSAFKLLESIRERAIGLPILVLTAYGNRELSDRLEKLKIVDYLTKPFNSEELIKRISLLVNHES
jgi:DNA-binding response OmpR family regulator